MTLKRDVNKVKEVNLKALNYESYEEALKYYNPADRWKVFDGTPHNFNIAHECIDRHKGKGVAINVKFEDGHIESYTFNLVSGLSSKFANYLSNELGIMKGDKVAIMLPPSLEFYVSLFGCWKMGAIVIVCSPLLGDEAVKYRLMDSGALSMVTSKDRLKIVQGIHIKHLILKEELLDLISRESEKFKPSTSADDISLIQYTGGSTGLPKPIAYYHKSALAVAPHSRWMYGIKDDDRFFCTSPPAWGHGIWGGICAPLIFGVPTSTWSGKFIPDIVLEALEELRITNLTATPTAYRRLMEVKNFKKYDLTVNTLTYTGEPMDERTYNDIKRLFKTIPYTIYGSTETGPIIGDYPGFKNWRVKPGSLGRPLPGLTVYVVNQEGKPCHPNEIGEIAIIRKNELVRTGDLGYVDVEGYFWYKGRADYIIKTAGYRIGPEEVEAVIRTLPIVEDCAVIGSPDERRGQIIKAFIKLRSDVVNVEELKSAIKNHVKEKLGKYAYPREIVFIKEIPRTSIGKVDRKRLIDVAKAEGS